MSRKKRTLKEIWTESDNESDSKPPHKKQRMEERKEKEPKITFSVYEHESIAVVAPSNIDQIVGSSKIAAFDMDWTLIKPKSNKKFPQNRSDWTWMFECVPTKLKKLNDSGYQIVIFSNQNGIGSGKQSLSSVAGKIMDFANDLNLSLIALLSKEKDHWRKPNVSMWRHFASHYNGNHKIDESASFYVGDACGRPKAWNGDKKRKKDFSCSDRKFAHNLGIRFHSEQSYFLDSAECTNWKWLTLNPSEFVKECKVKIEDVGAWFHGSLPIAQKNEQNMVLMRGPPGCGKSEFCQKYLVSAGYVWINRDTLKTKAKCLKAVRSALGKGKCVVVDNTNPNKAARAPYIELAKEYKAKVRLFNMTTEREVAEHCNLVRERMTKSKIKRISSMVYNIFYKKVREDEAPSIEKEGLSEIVDVDFVPCFKDETHRKMWMQFT